jgi:hypothetical protein
MARSLYQQNDFTSGVLEPRLKGRIDIAQYFKGLQRGDNIMLLPQGGIRNRYGLQYMDTITSTNVRMFEFAISSDRIYLLVFYDNGLKIYKDGALVYTLQPGDITAPASLYSDATVRQINAAQLENVMLLVEENKAPQRIINNGTDTDWTLDEIPFINIPQFDYNDASSPTPVNDVQTLTFVNFTEGDRFQISIDNINTSDIAYSADSATTAANMVKVLKQHPLLGTTGIAVAGTLPSLAITLSGDSASDFAQHIAWPTAAISTSTDNSITVVQDQQGSSRKEDLWSATRGFPKTISFFQGRLWFGGTTSKPQSLLASRSGSYFDFELDEQLADDAILVTIATRTLNAITNIVAGRQLQVFTAGSEFSVPAEIPTPENIAIKTETNHGCSRINPVEIDGSTLFIERSGKAIREFLFNWQEESYTANSVSVLAQHLIKQPVSMAAQRGTSDDDANYVFIVNSDGTMAILNTLREQEIVAFTNATTDGQFIDAEVADSVPYVAVKRNINGSDVLYIEKMTFDVVLDSAFIYSGAATTTITGLDHLEGETVKVIADGAVLTDKTVSGGQITLERSAEYVEVGLWAKPYAQPMPLVGEGGSGANHLRYKSIPRISLRVHETAAIQIDGITVPGKTFGPSSSSPLNTTPQPYTGIINDIESLTGWDLEQAPTISQEQPGKLTVLNLSFELEAR